MMANVLSMDKQIRIINALAEGNSIRSIERQTEIHRDTIMRLGVRVGEGCERVMDEKMRDLSCKNVQIDELWGFIGKKQKHLKENDSLELGDVWTFVAIDADTKLVPCFRVGKRTSAHANAFVADLASRMKNRIQLSSDSLRAYAQAVELSFGCDVDYGQLIKVYATSEEHHAGRYSPGEVIGVEKTIITGMPDIAKISTSYVKSQNLTARMHIRRLTRLTNAFSKKLANFKAAIGLHYGYYNFVKRHSTLRCTPAMAAGIENSFLSVGDLIEMSQ
jgi:IS1 family transposase